MAPLLPKLRGKFAEFLHQSSLARLRILSSPTCVGFGTGTRIAPHEAFLGDVSDDLRNPKVTVSASSAHVVADFPTTRARESHDYSNSRYARLIDVPSPLGSTLHGWYTNFNALSIAYAFRPRLRS